jgi:subtilase family serine protease
MSWGAGEYSYESSYDSYFATPSGHAGVTFLASTGDSGAPAEYPAFSPNVVAIGGTTLTLNGNNYSSESAWARSGGGISQYESQPSYESGKVNGTSSSFRTAPDVSMDAGSSVAVLDTYNSGWTTAAGTSVSTPMWAGLIAIADQGLAINGVGSLKGATQTLPTLYNLPSSDFHDITSGNNGFAATTGYDLASGLGTPVANLLVPGIVSKYSGTSQAPSITSANHATFIVGTADVPTKVRYFTDRDGP